MTYDLLNFNETFEKIAASAFPPRKAFPIMFTKYSTNKFWQKVHLEAKKEQSALIHIKIYFDN